MNMNGVFGRFLWGTHNVCWHAAKTALWSPLYYGRLPYLVTFAAASSHIQFYAIQRGDVGNPLAVGGPLRLETMSGRVKALLAVINLHRVLRTMESYLPKQVLPVDQTSIIVQDGYTREL